MEQITEAYSGTYIHVEDISTDLMNYIELSADYIKQMSGNYINIYKYPNEDT